MKVQFFRTLTLLIFSLGLILIKARMPAADDWPEFRGATGQGLATATNVPIRWSATNNVAWKSAIPGEGWSSPVLANGRIYLTTATTASESGQPSLRALSVDAESGKILWDVEALQPESGAAAKRHQKNGIASPTPVIQGDRIFVHFGHMGTAALDLTGKVIWRQTELKYPPTHGNGGS
ncbi:MAG: PQQ-binding-like beta-propeller repeat protein, partial [Verrucomicrobiota bacterium]